MLYGNPPAAFTLAWLMSTTPSTANADREQSMNRHTTSKRSRFDIRGAPWILLLKMPYGLTGVSRSLPLQLQSFPIQECELPALRVSAVRLAIPYRRKRLIANPASPDPNNSMEVGSGTVAAAL